MVLQTTLPLSLTDVATEFGATAPYSLTSFYRTAGLDAANATNGQVPSTMTVGSTPALNGSTSIRLFIDSDFNSGNAVGDITLLGTLGQSSAGSALSTLVRIQQSLFNAIVEGSSISFNSDGSLPFIADTFQSGIDYFISIPTGDTVSDYYTEGSLPGNASVYHIETVGPASYNLSLDSTLYGASLTSTGTSTYSTRDTSSFVSENAWDLRVGDAFNSDSVVYTTWDEWAGNYLRIDGDDDGDNRLRNANSIIVTSGTATATFETSDSDVQGSDSTILLDSITAQTGTPASTGAISIETFDNTGTRILGSYTANQNATQALNELRTVILATPEWTTGAAVAVTVDSPIDSQLVRAVYTIEFTAGASSTLFVDLLASENAWIIEDVSVFLTTTATDPSDVAAILLSEVENILTPGYEISRTGATITIVSPQPDTLNIALTDTDWPANTITRIADNTLDAVSMAVNTNQFSDVAPVFTQVANSGSSVTSAPQTFEAGKAISGNNGGFTAVFDSADITIAAANDQYTTTGNTNPVGRWTFTQSSTTGSIAAGDVPTQAASFTNNTGSAVDFTNGSLRVALEATSLPTDNTSTVSVLVSTVVADASLALFFAEIDVDSIGEHTGVDLTLVNAPAAIIANGQSIQVTILDTDVGDIPATYQLVSMSMSTTQQEPMIERSSGVSLDITGGSFITSSTNDRFSIASDATLSLAIGSLDWELVIPDSPSSTWSGSSSDTANAIGFRNITGGTIEMADGRFDVEIEAGGNIHSIGADVNSIITGVATENFQINSTFTSAGTQTGTDLTFNGPSEISNREILYIVGENLSFLGAPTFRFRSAQISMNQELPVDMGGGVSVTDINQNVPTSGNITLTDFLGATNGDA